MLVYEVHRHQVVHFHINVHLQKQHKGQTSEPLSFTTGILERWCQNHCYPEPDSSVNWQRFYFLAWSTDSLRVTCCTAAAISQTYANTFEIWDTDTSEVRVLLKDSVRNKNREDSQSKGHCKLFSLAYSSNSQQTIKPSPWMFQQVVTTRLNISF